MRIDLIADAAREKRNNCDWVGNNAAFTCPVCQRVFVVSAMLHRNGRLCPGCEKSMGHVTGGRNTGGEAFVEWKDDENQRGVGR
jgi:Zn finger protein HypA/HybF involved in hydrogenase expression